MNTGNRCRFYWNDSHEKTPVYLTIFPFKGFQVTIFEYVNKFYTTFVYLS